MKEKKLIFNFFVNRNWKKLTDSRKRAKILADNREGHHPIETLLGRIPMTSCAPVCFPRHNCAWLPESEVDCPATSIAHDFLNRHYKDTIRIFFSRLRRWDETKNPVTGNRLSQRSASPVPLDKTRVTRTQGMRLFNSLQRSLTWWGRYRNYCWRNFWRLDSTCA